MSAPIALRVTSRHKDFGDFMTGLYVWGGSTSDPAVASDAANAAQARDVIGGIPVLWWKLGTDAPNGGDDGAMEAVGYMQSVALDAVEFEFEFDHSGLPMAPDRAESSTFKVHDGTLELLSHDRELGLFTGVKFQIEPRLSWFLALCQTLSVVIESPSRTFVATMTTDGVLPRVVVHDGITTMPAFDAVVRRSARWAPVGLGNISLLAGMEDAPDHHTDTYAATASMTELPDRLAYQGDCIGCGAPGDSREHCVPNWIARDQGVKPVVAPVFCVSCNNHFGDALEKRISLEAREGRLGEVVESDLFASWAIKTALALSSACDVRVTGEWMRSLRKGVIPDGFQIFAETDAVMEEAGYQFSVTHFSRGFRKQGYFLFTFAMSGLIVVVLRNPSGLVELPGITRVRPHHPRDVRPGRIDATLLNDYVIELLTGHRVYRDQPIL